MTDYPGRFLPAVYRYISLHIATFCYIIAYSIVTGCPGLILRNHSVK